MGPAVPKHERAVRQEGKRLPVPLCFQPITGGAMLGGAGIPGAGLVQSQQPKQHAEGTAALWALEVNAHCLCPVLAMAHIAFGAIAGVLTHMDQGAWGTWPG